MRFYFCSPSVRPLLLRMGPRTGPLTVGAFSPSTRIGKGDRMFRGLIDHVRVFGSSTDGAGALSLEQIRNIQQGKENQR